MRFVHCDVDKPAEDFRIQTVRKTVNGKTYVNTYPRTICRDCDRKAQRLIAPRKAFSQMLNEQW